MPRYSRDRMRGHREQYNNIFSKIRYYVERITKCFEFTILLCSKALGIEILSDILFKLFYKRFKFKILLYSKDVNFEILLY